MRAAVVERYGGPEVVRLTTLPDPEAGSGEVLVRVEAAAVTSGDARIRAARFPRGMAPFARLALGVTRPRRAVLGSAFGGVVEAVGSGVTAVSPGDAVCGMMGQKLGAHAERLVAAATRVVVVPEGVSHDDAAGVLFGGTAALHFLRGKASIGAGTTVLVNGASGAIGTNAVQLACHMGASVTGVTSGANAALVEQLGATAVIDHTSVDLDAIDDRFDVVLDTVGNLSIGSGRRLLSPGGVLLLPAADLWEMMRARGDVKAGPAPERAAAFAELVGLVAAGDLRVVHDRAYRLDDIVEAHRRVDTGHKVGNVIVHPNQPAI